MFTYSAHIFFWFLCFWCLSLQSTAQNIVDSLLQKLVTTPQDTNRVLLLNDLRKNLANSKPMQSFVYAKEAVELAEKLQFTKGLAASYGGLGSFYRQQGDYSKATEYMLKALQFYEKLGKSAGIAATNNNLGVLFYRQGNWEKALYYYHHALALVNEKDLPKPMAVYLLNIGEVHQELHQYDSAIYYEQKSIEISKRHDIEENIAYALGIIGQVYAAQKQYEKALQYELKALNALIKIDDQEGVAEYQVDVAQVYLHLKKYHLAQQYAEACLTTARQNGSKQWAKEAYTVLAHIAETEHHFEKAYVYFKQATLLKDSLLNEGNSKRMAQMQILYETDKQQIEIGNLKKDKLLQDEQLKLQRWLLYLGGLIGVLITFFAVYLYRNNRIKQRTNLLLAKQKQAIEIQNTELATQQEMILLKNAELEQQKEEMQAQSENLMQAHEEISIQRDTLAEQNAEIKHKNNNIESSIRYALRIQTAFLPTRETIQKAFPSFFVFYRPRDIVSGDFYWLYQDDTYRILAAADCTGHGVPGALMSMMGNTLLNQTVQDRQIVQPNKILDELHKGIRKALKQDDTENRDGMDISIITVEHTPTATNLQFAGANNSIILFLNGELQELKADKLSIGGLQLEENRAFNLQNLVIMPTDKVVCYLYSDGFQDQFGGQQNRKLGRAKFRELIGNLQQHSLVQQGEEISLFFEEWRGTNDQIDDVMVIGVELQEK